MKNLSILLALSLLSVSGSVFAQDCELSISGNDQIQYSKEELTVPAGCDEVTLTLTHEGSLPVKQMGHNWVLSATEDWEAVAQEGMAGGLENDYLPQDDDRVIVHTDMIGGGEETSITFDVSGLERGGDYTFFCSFPGHWANMNGKFVLES